MKYLWGIVLVILGLNIIGESIFGITVPLFRIFLGFFLICLGILFLIPHQRSFSFTNAPHTIRGSEQRDYFKTFFSNTEWFLNDRADQKNITIYNETLFGSTTFFIRPDQFFKLHITGSFSTIILPLKKITLNTQDSFSWTNGTAENNQNIILDISVKFGTIKIIIIDEKKKIIKYCFLKNTLYNFS